MYPVVRSQGIPESHCTPNYTTGFIRKDTEGGCLGSGVMVALALVRCCRELSRRKAYGMGFSRMEISGVRIGGILGTGAFSKPGTEIRLLPYRQGATKEEQK